MLLLMVDPLNVSFHLQTFFSSSNSQMFSPKAQDSIMLSNTTEISSISDDKERIIIPLCTIADVNGKEHHLVAYPQITQSNGKKCTKTRACKECHSKGVRH
jgi:hypothetical protein